MALRAAFFTSLADNFGRPLDDGIIRALLHNGFEIDVFAPRGDLPQTLYPPTVRRLAIEYRLAWLRQNLNLSRRRGYALFLGTPELPVAMAGCLAAVGRRSVVAVCDEVYVGSYKGEATLHWRWLAPWAMRRARFTVITDLCRTELQRSYASLPKSHPFHAYPCCYADPFEKLDRASLRAKLGIADDDFVLGSTGWLTADRGGHWVVRLPTRIGSRTKLLVQTAGRGDPLLDALLHEVERRGDLVYVSQRLEWRESMRTASLADVGLVFYLSPKPQFQAMGLSSQRLCTHLWLGQPVVATHQKSFEFLEEYGCGVLVKDEGELPRAIERIRSDYATYSRNALRCVATFIKPKSGLDRLTSAFAAFR